MWEWLWALQDGSGLNLSLLTGATGRAITYTRSATPEASFELDLEHDDAYVLRDALALGLPRLRCFRVEPDIAGAPVGVCRHGGLILPTDETASSGNVKVTSPGAFVQLEGRDTGDAIFGRDMTPAADIAVELLGIAELDGPTGIVVGDVPFTEPRDVTLDPHKRIADAWVDLADAFDYELVPLADSTGQGFDLARVDFFTRQGDTRDGAAFGYGVGTIGNCTDATRQTLRPRNRVFVLGDEGIVGMAEDSASIDRYGVWGAVESMSDVVDLSLLDARAAELLQPNLEVVVTFDPDPAKVDNDGAPLTPVPGVDYWLGDSVPLSVRKGAFRFDGYVRVDGITINIDDDGHETSHSIRIADAESGA